MYAQRHSSNSHHSYKAPGLHSLVKMNEKNKLKLWMSSYMLIDKLLACLNKPKKKIAFYDTHISVKSHFISFSRSAFQRFSYLPPKPQDISHTFFFSLYCSCFVRSHQTCKDDTCDRTWFQMSVSPYHLQKLQIVFLLFFTPFLGWLCSSYAIDLRGKWKCRYLSEKERKAQLENSSVVTQIIHFTKQHACLAFWFILQWDAARWKQWDLNTSHSNLT